MEEIVNYYKEKGFKLMYDRSKGSLHENVKLPMNPSAVLYNDKDLLTLLEYHDFDADMVEARCEDYIQNCWIPYERNYYLNKDYFKACLKVFGKEVGKVIINILFDIRIKACISQLYLIHNAVGREWMYCKNCTYKTAVIIDASMQSTMKEAIRTIYLSVFTELTYSEEVLFENIGDKSILIIKNETLFKITGPARFGRTKDILNDDGSVKAKFKR
jgi:hypothetical protein